MTPTVGHELLALHALDALDADDAARVEAAVAADPALARELDALRAAAAAIAGELPVVAPPAGVKARLEASLDALTRPGRLDRFAARLAALFDVTVDKARMMLAWIDQPDQPDRAHPGQPGGAARWEAMAPGVSLMHLPAGPACAGADCGFVRLEPGTTFPWHAHDGEEVTVVLQGRARDADGTALAPGAEMVLGASTAHDFHAEGEVGDEPYIFAVRVFGVRFDVARPA